uniref:Uncharacterized protein n=1 Tax=Spongospora subterranea TaxID=70186 RepID=A0A0H5R6W4_9EUKA|eukprot:CRZ09853.1 hypothetical protein [Spongospora subterranea]
METSSSELAFSQANSLFVDEDYQGSLALYTQAINIGPATAQYYSKRSANYFKLGQYNKALQDANSGIELTPEDPMLYQRKGMALYQLGQILTASSAFAEAKALGATVDGWISKCEAESEGLVANFVESAAEKPKNVPKASEERNEVASPVPVLTLADKVRESFYDNQESVTITFYAKNVKKSDVNVQFIDNQTVDVKATLPDGSILEKSITLFSTVVSNKSNVDVTPYKISIVLQKQLPGLKWDRLRDSESTSYEEVISHYPSSSKKKQDWGSLEKEVAKEEEKEKPEGDQALNQLFQQIYSNASDETKRAMIKSYQTSGGTVLSTNWDEVKSKNYEESVEAPAGMEVRHWNK